MVHNFLKNNITLALKLLLRTILIIHIHASHSLVFIFPLKYGTSQMLNVHVAFSVHDAIFVNQTLFHIVDPITLKDTHTPTCAWKSCYSLSCIYLGQKKKATRVYKLVTSCSEEPCTCEAPKRSSSWELNVCAFLAESLIYRAALYGSEIGQS